MINVDLERIDLGISKSAQSALVLLSGGQDSTTALFWAKRAYENVFAVAFDYGQRHRVELDRAAKIAQRASVPLAVCDVTLVSSSPLVDPSALTRWADRDEKGRPPSFVPGRNASFLALAAGYAFELNAPNLVLGANAIDFSGYPDCRPEALESFRSGLALMLDWPALHFAAPLISASKAEICMFGHALGRDCWDALSISWSCYDPQPRAIAIGPGPCGACPACELRAKGFLEAGLKDPALR